MGFNYGSGSGGGSGKNYNIFSQWMPRFRKPTNPAMPTSGVGYGGGIGGGRPATPVNPVTGTGYAGDPVMDRDYNSIAPPTGPNVYGNPNIKDPRILDPGYTGGPILEGNFPPWMKRPNTGTVTNAGGMGMTGTGGMQMGETVKQPNMMQNLWNYWNMVMGRK